MRLLTDAIARRRSAFLGLVLTALAVAAVIGLPAGSEANTRCGLEFYYYSDPGLTNLIGVRGWLPTECGCGSYGWGSLSAYREIYDSWC
jgi:hypothetical protein